MQIPEKDDSVVFSLNAKGIRLTGAGKYGEAIALFDKAIAAKPGLSGLYFNRAEARRLSGDLPGARSDLEQALAIVPGDPEFLHALGLVSYEEDDFESAAGFYRGALDIDPGLAKAWNDLGVVNFRKGAFSNAKDCFTRATEEDTAMAEAWFNLADTCEELGLKSERRAALEGLQKAQALPGGGEALE
ncbi:MAG: tetratricopeptide repeat protein [Treponema sp.]|jgi:tetratricopeptide (TPR) repeat protein|nr:tetratricopeptide repeat protein [Treponema sp.]HOI22972.1 tetratricopeptide repeat protein [Spirochaetales bacterium]